MGQLGCSWVGWPRGLEGFPVCLLLVVFSALLYFLFFLFNLSNCFCFVNHIVSTKISNSSYTIVTIIFVVVKIRFQ